MLAGRDHELGTVAALLDLRMLAPGQVRLVQVDGAIGVGKSAFLAGALARVSATSPGDGTRPVDPSADARAPRVFLSQGDHLHNEAPLAAHRHMLEDLLGEPLEHLLDDAPPSVLASRCLEALHDDAAVVAVDDAHWLDRTSEDFLIALLGTPAPVPLAIVLVHRPGLEPERVVTAARRRGAAHDHITLGPLPDEVIGDLGTGLSAQQVDAVRDAAAGNPLLAQTAVAAFRRHPAATRVDDVLRLAAGSRAAMLSAAVADDMATLDDASRRALETLAVLGNDGTGTEASDVAGLAPAEFEAAERELADRGLLSDSPHEALHPVVRYSVYQNTDVGRREQMHRRAASLPDAHLLRRADHVAQVGSDLTADESGVLVDAAHLAIGTDPRAASHWLARLPAAHRSSRSELLLARALILEGKTPEALDRLRRLVDEHPGAPPAKALILLASALRISGDPIEARAVLASADDSVDAELLREHVDVVALLDGRVPERLLSRLEQLPGEENRVVAAVYRTMDLLSEGRVPQARATFAPVPGWLASAESREVADVVHAVACAVWAAYMLDDYGTGARLAERSLQLAHRFGQADARANLGTGLLFCRASLGLLDKAEQAGEQAVLDAERYGPADVIGMARAGLMVVAQGRGDPELLRRRLEEVDATALPEFGWWRRAILTLRTRVSAQLGRPEPCPELLGEPRDAMTALRHADAAVVAAAMGDPTTAASLVAEGVAIAESQGQAGQKAMIQTAYAEILLAAGEPLEAVNLLRSAREIFERRDMRLQLGRAQAGLARAEAMLARLSEPLGQLTPREREVLELVVAGLKNGEIAERLTLSKRTAENHVSRLLRKLGVSSREEAADLVPWSGRQT